MMELGNGRYQPAVTAFFPKLGRGHTNMRPTKAKPKGGICAACRQGGSKEHAGQKKNREDWEESVGIHHTSRLTRNATSLMTRAQAIAADPKGLRNSVASEVAAA